MKRAVQRSEQTSRRLPSKIMAFTCKTEVGKAPIATFFLGVALLAVLAFAIPASGGVFVEPAVSGTTPRGNSWAWIATGQPMPIRSGSTSPENGAPGAVAYWNTETGQLQIDPKGWNITEISFTYTTGTVNPSRTTPGPLVYASGTSPLTAVVSGASGVGNQRTLPAGTWSLIYCTPCRVGGIVTITAPGTPTLATNYDNGNGAGGSSPYATNPIGGAVTPGFFTQPWAFPSTLVNSGSVASMSVDNWKVFNAGPHANSDFLGYGNFRGVFFYRVEGVVGNQVGPVIPVTAVPEPSTYAMALTGLACGGFLMFRRRKRA